MDFYTDIYLQFATFLVQDIERQSCDNMTVAVSLCRQGPCDSEKNLKISASHGCLRFQGQCVEGNGTFQGQCVEWCSVLGSHNITDLVFKKCS
jgi:hypothetical protein